MSGPDGVDRRQEPRYDVKIEVDWQADETFLFAYITDISTLGIFVATERPPEIGTEIKLRFPTPASASADAADAGPAPRPEPIEAVGRVRWTSSGDAESGDPGMGIQFTDDLDPTTRTRIIELVRAVAYLDSSS